MMVTPELLAFIREQEAAGVPRETIRATLKAQGGWEERFIMEAFAQLPRPSAPAPRAPAPAPQNLPGVMQPAAQAEPVQPEPVRTSFAPSEPAVAQPSYAPASSVEAEHPPLHAPTRAPIIAPLLMGLVVIAALGGGIAYAFSTGLFGSFSRTPEERVLAAIDKMRTASSFAFSATVTTEVEETPARDAAAKMPPTEIRAEGVAHLEEGDADGVPDAFLTFSSAPAGGASSLGLEGDLYLGDRSLALRLRKPEMLVIFDLSPIIGRWIDLSAGTMAAEASATGLPLDPGLVDLLSISKNFGPALAHVFSEAESYLDVEELADEGGLDRYRVLTDTALLVESIKRSPLVTDPELSADARQRLIASYDAYAAKGAVSETVVGIDPSTGYVVESSTVSREQTELLGATFTTTTTHEARYFDFNDAPAIETPSDLISASEAMELVLSNLESLFGSQGMPQAPVR